MFYRATLGSQLLSHVNHGVQNFITILITSNGYGGLSDVHIRLRIAFFTALILIYQALLQLSLFRLPLNLHASALFLIEF